MFTYSGSKMFPNKMEGMSFLDVAISLGRMPRFSGHTMQWWPVLAHSMVCYELSRIHNVQDPRLRFHVLFHDGHESVKGDTTRHWKTDEIRAQEHAIDVCLFTNWGLALPNDEDRAIIKTIDNIALAAEAYLVGPPGPFAYEKCEPPDFQTTRLVIEYMKDFEDANYANGPYSTGVVKFVTIAQDLYRQIRYG